MNTKMLLVALVSGTALAACSPAATTGDKAGAAACATAGAPITAEEVAAAQKAWGEGIVAIGKTFTDKGDIKAAAENHIRTFYAYDDGGKVLFKPTLAKDDQFRGSFEEALNYFIGKEGTEDNGFAIKPWTNVRWENEATITDGDSAVAMGNYYFTDTDGKDTKVEYTFGYVRAADGKLKINVHHSSVPFAG